MTTLGVDEVRLLARGSALDRAPADAEAFRAFEALLIREMARPLARPLLGDPPLGGGAGGRLYLDLFGEEVARLAASRGGFGIARVLGEGAGSEGEGAP